MNDNEIKITLDDLELIRSMAWVAGREVTRYEDLADELLARLRSENASVEALFADEEKAERDEAEKFRALARQLEAAPRVWAEVHSFRAGVEWEARDLFLPGRVIAVEDDEFVRVRHNEAGLGLDRQTDTTVYHASRVHLGKPKDGR